jgi:hypothetical protein
MTVCTLIKEVTVDHKAEAGCDIIGISCSEDCESVSEEA